METQFVQCNDVNIAYTENGEGETLLLLHGNSESKALFKKYQHTFFPDFHTFALDSRGHGQSSWNGENLTIEQFCDDVIEFCRQKSITKASVIGFSDGGNIALYLAKKEPFLFENVIALSPNTLVTGTEIRTLALMRFFYKMFLILKRIGFKTDLLIKRFNLMLTDIGLSFEDLASIQTKVHLIYSEHDMITEEHMISLHKAIKNSTLYKEMNANHMSEVEKKDVIAHIRKLLV